MPDNISALWLTKSTSYVNHFYSSGKNLNQGNGTKLSGRSPQRKKQPRSNPKMLYLEVLKSKKKEASKYKSQVLKGTQHILF